MFTIGDRVKVVDKSKLPDSSMWMYYCGYCGQKGTIVGFFDRTPPYGYWIVKLDSGVVLNLPTRELELLKEE